MSRSQFEEDDSIQWLENDPHFEDLLWLFLIECENYLHLEPELNPMVLREDHTFK